uniref:Uncharacterized protein n=1 Tax=Strigamia maritima TaxID=126957 RepID=T1IVI6_STRMM
MMTLAFAHAFSPEDVGKEKRVKYEACFCSLSWSLWPSQVLNTCTALATLTVTQPSTTVMPIPHFITAAKLLVITPSCLLVQ